MFAEWILILIFLGIGYMAYNLHRIRANELIKESSRLNKMLSLNVDVRKILLAGMYQRFKREEGKTEDTPLDFEYFVAKTIQIIQGGTCEVTPPSNDGGIDILHYSEDGLQLVQVKCYAPNNRIDFQPIAVLHSQMVKQDAEGALVVTTSSFSQEAIRYAKEVNVRLIDGEQFLDMWLQSINITLEEIGEGSTSPLTPFYN
ncbi:restriction endonuclease [Paenibacillus sp. LHD-38]|uniref:restriction endonuclease n=1 Tax=Paenibacillus sp. LHD-38 TaxID=3072143 RepID=UPI00280DC102|nr:restriction endonuclease [Paenibacillus sp. LHD-38]MDQ8735101.1 restriction endonuclease [Paenibacillus sp. LHD-38]